MQRLQCVHELLMWSSSGKLLFYVRTETRSLQVLHLMQHYIIKLAVCCLSLVYKLNVNFSNLLLYTVYSILHSQSSEVPDELNEDCSRTENCPWEWSKLKSFELSEGWCYRSLSPIAHILPSYWRQHQSELSFGWWASSEVRNGGKQSPWLPENNNAYSCTSILCLWNECA